MRKRAAAFGRRWDEVATVGTPSHLDPIHVQALAPIDVRHDEVDAPERRVGEAGEAIADAHVEGAVAIVDIDGRRAGLDAGALRRAVVPGVGARERRVG